ncbi:hypothetical protein O7635_21375 [Asanoa sp. WMMD1127]|uniref:hypothetical protein n=1 Tax=Asanoa sp. WMMD1127 TaxID=3016107 RepID=UPI002416F2EC|nr:hypothetical protein [Asanoa sp. WMMD1127]MDG4824410.1 hypothetical protein [Asanoa sp. WMMD1127]
MIAVLDATRDLLAALDPLPHPRRMGQLASWAAAASDRAEVCADLRAGGTYERHLALVAAMVARDAAGIAAAAGDPDPVVRAVAIRAALRSGTLDWSAIDPSAAERRLIYRTLRRLPQSLADGLIHEVRTRYDDTEAAALLPACGSDTVRALLPELEHAVKLTALVRRHAAVVLDRVGTRLAEAVDRDEVWAETVTAVLRCAPAGVLDLLERYAPEDRLPGRPAAYGVLAAHDAGRVARLLAAPGRTVWLRDVRLPRGLLRRLAGLPDGDLLPLLRARRHNFSATAAVLRAVSPGRRAALYDGALAEPGDGRQAPDAPAEPGDGPQVPDAPAEPGDERRVVSGRDALAEPGRGQRVPGYEVVDVLPAVLREREARRALGLPAIREREALVREWSAFLPWPAAVAALAGASRSGDADERAHAYRLLVDAARRSRDPAAVADLLTRLDRLRNEQDPVRAAALTALAKVSRLLGPASVAALTRLATDAVEARDTSAATTGALSSLAADVLRDHVDVPELREWALTTIDRTTAAARVPMLRRFDLVLRRGQERLVVDRLSGWVTNAAARGWYGPLFALTHALGRRARRVPALQDMLRRAIPDTTSWTAGEAIRLWLDDPATRYERVGEVLALDPTAVALPVVWETVIRSRTDLLDRVLRRRPRGRFVEHGVRWVPMPTYARRWVPRQQAAFAGLLELVVDDSDVAVWQRAAAIKGAARIPGAGRELVLRHVDAAEVVIAEAALGALVWTDRPAEALEVLLAHAGDDRARVALYAAERAARYVAPARLPELLAPVISGPAKVTSRKAAARMLARYGPPEVMATLRAAYDGAHRDVRAAIVAAATERLGVDDSWAILADAGTGSREERRAILDAAPRQVADRHRARYAALVVAECRAADRELRRAAFARLPRWARWVDGASGLVVDRLTDLGERQHRWEIAELLRLLDEDAATTTFARLVERDAADDRPGDPDSDRPARRRIEDIAGAAATWRRQRRSPEVPAMAAALRRLAAQPGFTHTAVIALTDVALLDNADALADLCAGRPALAGRTAEEIGKVAYQAWPDADVLAVATRWAGRGDLAGGLFAVRILAGSGQEWTAPRRDLLLTLRVTHAEPDVRELAYEVNLAED